MTPIKYCYDVLLKTRDPFYFCAKKVSAQHREALVAIRAFYITIEQLILEDKDPTIVMQQLLWWREEILKDNPQHPIAILLHSKNVSKESLVAIIESYIGLMNNSFFEQFEDVVIFIMQTAGRREKLMIDIIEPNHTISSETIYELTLALELTHYIQHLRSYIRRGILLFPETELLKFNLTRDDFSHYKTTPDIQNLLEYQTQKIDRIHQKTSELKSFPSLKLLITQVEIANCLMKEIRGDQYRVLENYIQLTPLKMWWLGYI